MELYNVVDEETGFTYSIEMTRRDAKRFETEIVFATQKLEEAKNKLEAQRIAVEPESEKLEINKSMTLDTDISEMFDVDDSAAFDICGSIESPAENSTQPEPDSAAFKWPHNAILFLIEQYQKKENEFYSGKVPQKKVWQAISKQLNDTGYNVTGPQCMSKFQSLKRTYKAVKDHNSKSGNSTKTWPYYDIMQELLGSKPNIEPVATISSTGKRAREVDESNIKSSKKMQSSHLSSQDLLTSINKTKETAEQNRERRHQETMKQRSEAITVFKELLDLLKK